MSGLDNILKDNNNNSKQLKIPKQLDNVNTVNRLLMDTYKWPCKIHEVLLHFSSLIIQSKNRKCYICSNNTYKKMTNII